jgi:hypothetical protein
LDATLPHEQKGKFGGAKVFLAFLEKLRLW